jgi:LDH2 family malate/lactate/ureidoglycolate dehydrogenase
MDDRSDSPPETVDADLLIELVARVFGRVGIPAEQAAVVAESLVDADRRGLPSHGVLLVPMYIERIEHGSVSRAISASTVTDVAAVAVLDAQHALGQLTSDQAMSLAVSKAQRFGVGAVSVRHAFHFGAASRYVRQATEAGCIGIAASNTRPLMPAPGGAEPVGGNNPLAMGVPRGEGPPMILDMALSQAALGKIRLAEAEGREIPDTWATAPDGTPTTDPTAALAGMLLPAAGHKGFGLALMVEVLTGVLSGGAFSHQVHGLYADAGAPNDCAHFFLALDVDRIAGMGAFTERVDQLALMVTHSRRAPGVDVLMLPGQPEDERAAARGGRVPVDPSVIRELRRVAVRLGVDSPLTSVTAGSPSSPDPGGSR